MLDLACGNAPMAAHLPGRAYLGVDLSAQELAAAAASGNAVARADAAALPLRDQSIDAVVISMALMLVPLQPTLREIARVLRPGGLLVATVPHPRPLPARDWLRYARLCLALRHPGLSRCGRRRPRARRTAGAGRPRRARSPARAAAGRWGSSPGVADDLLRSLYLPDVRPERMQAGRRVVRRWVGTSIALPLRRIVARLPN